MGRAMFPPYCLTRGQTMVEVPSMMTASFKRSHAHTAALGALDPAAGHCWSMPLPEMPGHSRASLGQSVVGSLLLSPGSWCTRFCLCLQESVFPVLCKFWWLYGVVNGDLLQEGLWHTQIYCTQSPCPCGRSLLTCTFAGDTSTLMAPSLWDLWVLVCKPSEYLWQVWGLILNVILPLLPSCWGFSFALG